ncbi:28 kDa A-kinase anchor [Plasmodiophora brassicae]|uniref:Uncharacterized protein n=1 Tax=Plasmodiophora brassicae TaxID=37360 RepID=A0A0G4IXJ0_PLABS|nr:hypothetical protein PBRA_007495 [Plasmodiophora brassicae]SPQ97077.1 unnamed protein product [Plasmodiophora brassicae]
MGDDDDADVVAKAKAALQDLFTRWDSSFGHRMTHLSTSGSIVDCNVTFSRATVEQPVPGMFVNVLFHVDVGDEAHPKISFQVEGEQYLYTIPDSQGASKNIDQLIINNLEFKQRLRDAFSPQILASNIPLPTGNLQHKQSRQF